MRFTVSPEFAAYMLLYAAVVAGLTWAIAKGGK